MPPEEKDPAFLWDMREACRKLADLVLQTTEAEFPAAARVSETYRLQQEDRAL